MVAWRGLDFVRDQRRFGIDLSRRKIQEESQESRTADDWLVEGRRSGLWCGQPKPATGVVFHRYAKRRGTDDRRSGAGAPGPGTLLILRCGEGFQHGA